MEDKFEEFKATVENQLSTLTNSVDKRLKSYLWLIGIALSIMVAFSTIWLISSNIHSARIDDIAKKQITVEEWKKYCEDRINKLESDNALIKKNALKKDRFNVSSNLMSYKIDELKAILEDNKPAILRTREKIIEYQNKLMSLDNDDVTRGITEIQ
jgi:hypothetical protein